MQNNNPSVNDILMHFYELSRDIHHPERKVFNHIVREKNKNVLRNFLACAELCFKAPEMRSNFNKAVRDYFKTMDGKPADCINALVKIQALQQFLDTLDDSSVYSMYLGKLNDYSR